MKKEIWKNIPNLKGYQASSFGRIRSIDRKIKRMDGITVEIKGSIRKTKTDKDGYLRIVLSFNNKQIVKSVHRIIALTFMGESNLQINHKNGIRSDNRLANIEYNSCLKNMNHRERKLNNKKKYGAYKKDKKWFSVIKINRKNFYIGSFKTKQEAHNAFYNKYYEIHGKYPW